MQNTDSADSWNQEGSITRSGDRTVGFAEYGRRTGTAVLWCHGAPGSRLEPRRVHERAFEADFHIAAADRPGYGLSNPQPGRTISDSVEDGLAVLDHLDIERFYVVGVSTGGAYALACAALVPERVLGVVACCANTDARHPPAREAMHASAVRAVWDAPDRTRALETARRALGEDGSKLLNVFELSPSDLALFGDPTFLAGVPAAIASQFAHGVEGYTDDRIADRNGWTTFDVSNVRCPVLVLHGSADTVVDVLNAHYTARIVPGAKLRIVEGLGHLSIFSEIVPALADLRSAVDARLRT